MSKIFWPILIVMAKFTAVSLLVLMPIRSVQAQPNKVCYNLLEPIWQPATYTNTKLGVDSQGFWQTQSCEVLSPEEILELFLRGQLSHLDDALRPGVQQAAFVHMTILKASAVSIAPAVQSLFEQLLTSQIGADMPSFNIKQVQDARLLPRGAAPVSLYLHQGDDFAAITLNDLIIINDSDYAVLVNSPIPTDTTLSSMIQPSDALNPQFANAFALLAHELVHVRQYDELGMDTFQNYYLLETMIQGYGRDSFEREAAAYGKKVQNYLFPLVCHDAIQGKIAWDYKNNTTWNEKNIERLCSGNQSSAEPASCFDQIMHGGINWGRGTQWTWETALDLCEGTMNADKTIFCFQSELLRHKGWQAAIAVCG